MAIKRNCCIVVYSLLYIKHLNTCSVRKKVSVKVLCCAVLNAVYYILSI